MPSAKTPESAESVQAVFVGAATYDAIALVDAFPGPDERVVAADVVYAGGGPAATAAVTAARLGVSVAFLGTVGADATGRAVLDGLVAEGVDVSGVTVSAVDATAASVIVVDRVRGSRAICNRPAPRIDLSAGRHFLTSAPVVHLDHAGWAPWRTAMPGGRAVRDQLVSVDAGHAIPGFTPAAVDLFVPTVEALQRSYGHASTNDLMALAVAEGAHVVVATDGSRGSSARTALGDTAFAPAHPVDVVSTLGAGDVFHGALIAAVVRGLPLAQQLTFANITAALSCRGLDGRSRIPRLDEVLDAMSTLAR